MNRPLISLGCALLLLATGCFMGDPGTAKIVSLTLPAREGQSKVSLSVDDAEVQEALKVIDTVLVSYGLSRVPMSQVPGPDGSIAHYQGAPRGCSVSLSGSTLFIVFSEFGRRSPTESVKRISSSLAEQLRKTYGTERVRVATH